MAESGAGDGVELSLQPRLFLYPNFLSRDECEYLIELAKPDMKISKVVGHNNGQRVESSVRTSTGTFLKQSSDETIQNIEKRIATITTLPAENGESLHVLHYGVGEQYERHFDYLHPTPALTYGGQRVATFLMYLSDVEEGGETEFPRAQGISSLPPEYRKLVDTCKGLKVKPKMGNALLFWNTKSDGKKDLSSEHGSCPVIRGDKWVCTNWIHACKFQVQA